MASKVCVYIAMHVCAAIIQSVRSFVYPLFTMGVLFLTKVDLY